MHTSTATRQREFPNSRVLSEEQMNFLLVIRERIPQNGPYAPEAVHATDENKTVILCPKELLSKRFVYSARGNHCPFCNAKLDLPTPTLGLRPDSREVRWER